MNANRVGADARTNSPYARTFPGSGQHQELATYWGTECARAIAGLLRGEFVTLNEGHAYRTARMAGYHGMRGVDRGED